MLVCSMVTKVLRGETPNHKSGVVTKGFLWMVFCHAPFSAYCAARLVKCIRMKMCSLNMENFACVASASSQLRIRKTNP